MNISDIDYVVTEHISTNFPTGDQILIKESKPRNLYIYRDPSKFQHQGINGTRNGTLALSPTANWHKQETLDFFNTLHFSTSPERNFQIIFNNFKHWPSFMFWSDEHGENYQYYINIDNIVDILILNKEEAREYGYSTYIYLFKFKNNTKLVKRIDHTYLFDKSFFRDKKINEILL
jgi:hypothetical protein